jgi:CO/xanthine dehydrogenase FAD-binding subunit
MDETTLRAHLLEWYGQDRLLPLLPLLEYPFEEAQQIVREAYTQAGLSQEAYGTFAFDQLIVFALTVVASCYWAERAVEWLVQGAPMTERIAQAVEALIAQKGATQQARHRAGKIIRQWRRQHTCK